MTGRSTIPTILVPISGTPISARSIPTASLLATATGASLKLLRVVEPRFWGEAGHHLALRQQAAIESLQQFIAGAEQGHNQPIAAAHVGIAGQTILMEAQASDVSLVAMATHSREGIIRTILGSVAEDVLAACPVPVVLVPARANTDRSSKPFRILVPLDGSRLSRVILPSVADLALALGAEVIALQVHVPGRTRHLGDHMVSQTVEAMDEPAGEMRGESLQAADLGRGGWPSLRVIEQFELGNPAERILAVADRERPTLIAMGTRGRTGLDARRPSPLAARVLRHSPVPVLAFGPALLRRLGGSEAISGGRPAEAFAQTPSEPSRRR